MEPTTQISTRAALTGMLRVPAVLFAAFLVVRGLVEFVTIDWGNPASYRDDWGGPSLLGVLAVHSGPGLLILGVLAVRLYRNRSAKLGRT